MNLLAAYTLCLIFLAAAAWIRLEVSRGLKRQYLCIIENITGGKKGLEEEVWCIISISYSDPDYRYLTAFVEKHRAFKTIILLTAPEWLYEVMKRKLHLQAHIHSTQSDWLKSFRNRSEVVVVAGRGKVYRTNNISVLNHGELITGVKGGEEVGIP